MGKASIARGAGQGEVSSSATIAAGGGLLLTAFTWGATIPVTHRLLQGLDPFLLGFGRYLLALPVLWVFLQLLERGKGSAVAVPWRRVLALGIFGMGGFANFYTFGIMFSDPVTAAVILTSGPVVAALMARVMYAAPFEKGLGLALVLAVGGGVAVVLGAARPAGVRFHLQGGEVLLIFAQVAWTWYSMKTQEWLAPLGLGQLRITLLTASACTAFLGLVFAVMALGGHAALPLVPPTANEWAMLAVVGAGGAGMAVVLWNIGANRLGVPVATLYTNLVPVSAVGISALFGAQMTLWQGFGGVLVLAGVVQMQVRRLRRLAAQG